MPTIVRVYSNTQSNPMVKKAIEYCCRQFYVLHRLPFILQMLGSVSTLLDSDEQAEIADSSKIQPLYLFRLLISLEQAGAGEIHDHYSILELIRNDLSTVESPSNPLAGVAATRQGNLSTMTQIKSLDFCYVEDDNLFTFLQCLDLCVSVGECAEKCSFPSRSFSVKWPTLPSPVGLCKCSESSIYFCRSISSI